VGYAGGGCDSLKLAGVGRKDVREQRGDIEGQEDEENDE
jgi:hypothetical protein